MRDLDDLVLEWEDRKAAGELGCLEELCALNPDLADSLREEVKMLEAVDQLLTLEDSETVPERFAQKDVDIPKSLPGYEIKKVIGRGGMGVVLEGVDTSLNRPVALKTVHALWPPWFIIDQELLNRQFADEGQTLAKLNHPNIVDVRTTLTDNGRPYLVMELLQGSLASESEALTRLGTDAILIFMEKVARAVDHAHQNGVLHRDLKPANILLDKKGEPKVADFGLAKTILPAGLKLKETPDASPQREMTNGHSDYWTTPGLEGGTAPWMAPERLASPPVAKPTRAGDLWSLGVILYELLTGKRPFEGKTRQEIAEAISRGPPTSICELEPRLSPKLDAIVQRCLIADPRLRTQDAETLANELAALRRPRLPALHQNVALTAGVAVLVGLLLSVRSEPREDAYAKYETAASPLIARLKKQDRVELINPGMKPVHYVREGVGSTEVNPTPNGISVYAPAMSLIEFLPEVPVSHFRIEAQIEHSLSFNDKFGYIGLYCKAAHQNITAGRYHLLHLVRFTDIRNAPMHQASSAIFCFAMFKEPAAGKFPVALAHLAPDAPLSQLNFPAEPPGHLPIARKLTMEVNENGVVGSWDSGKNDGVKKTFAPLDNQVRTRLFNRLLRAPMYIDGIEKCDFSYLPNSSSVGILVSCGNCLVRSIRVTPLPNKNGP